MWPGKPVTNQNLLESDSSSYRYTWSRYYLFMFQTPTIHVLLGPGKHPKIDTLTLPLTSNFETKVLA